MPKFAFTFGQAYDLHDKFVTVEADDRSEARHILVRTRAAITDGLPDAGSRWAFDYPYPEFEEQIPRYGLSEVPIDTPIRWRDEANPKE